MQRSLSQGLNTLILAGATALGATVFTLPFAPTAVADTFAHYEPGFLRQAERALRRDAPQRALGILEEGVAQVVKARHRAEAEGLGCRAHLSLGDAEKARAACLAALELDSSRSSWRYLNNLGAAEIALGNHDAAETAFARAAAVSGWASAPRKNLYLLRELRDALDSASENQLTVQVR